MRIKKESMYLRIKTATRWKKENKIKTPGDYEKLYIEPFPDSICK